MIEKSLANYGAPYINAEAVIDPTSEPDAAFLNRVFEDLAQLTQTGDRIQFTFTTRVTPGAATVPAGNIRSMFAGATPAVARASTGVYTVTLNASYVDGLGTTEAVALIMGDAWVRGTTCAHAQTSLGGPPGVSTFTVYVFDATGAASDLSGTATVVVAAR